MNVTFEEYKSKYEADIKKLIQDDAYLLKLILECLDKSPKLGIVAKCENEIVGIGTFDGVSKMSAVILYVKPSKREEGIGSELLKKLELNMKKAGVKEIICDYKINESIKAFLYNRGYEYWFKSNFMIFNGNRFQVDDDGISNYEEDDYVVCQKILSEAFHKMRLSVGMESKLDQPSEKQRRWCQKNKNNIFLLRDNDRIVAVARLAENEIDAVAIDIEEWGKGYGKRMVKYSINTLLERGNDFIVLWAVEGNPAKFLYGKLGFKTERLHEFTKKHI